MENEPCPSLSASATKVNLYSEPCSRLSLRFSMVILFVASIVISLVAHICSSFCSEIIQSSSGSSSHKILPSSNSESFAPSAPSTMVTFLGSNKTCPVSPLIALKSSFPLNLRALRLEISAKPPSPRSKPPVALIVPSNRVRFSDQM